MHFKWCRRIHPVYKQTPLNLIFTCASATRHLDLRQISSFWCPQTFKIRLFFLNQDLINGEKNKQTVPSSHTNMQRATWVYVGQSWNESVVAGTDSSTKHGSSLGAPLSMRMYINVFIHVIVCLCVSQSVSVLLSAPLVLWGHVWTSASALRSFLAVMFILGCMPLCSCFALTYINTARRRTETTWLPHIKDSAAVWVCHI